MKRLALVALALLLLAPVAAAEGAEEDDGNDQLLDPVILFIILLIVGGVAIFFWGIQWWGVQYELQKWAVAFGEFAAAHGLEITGAGGRWPHPVVEGNYRRRQVRLDTYMVGAGKSSKVYTRLRLSIDPPFAGRLELRHEGLLAKLGKRFGTEDLQLHDIRFDPHYIVQCSDPALPEVVLRSGAREKLLGFKKWSFTWDDDEAEADGVGIETDPERLQALLEILSDIADELERYAGRAAR